MHIIIVEWKRRRKIQCWNTLAVLAISDLFNQLLGFTSTDKEMYVAYYHGIRNVKNNCFQNEHVKSHSKSISPLQNLALGMLIILMYSEIRYL